MGFSFSFISARKGCNISEEKVALFLSQKSIFFVFLFFFMFMLILQLPW